MLKIKKHSLLIFFLVLTVATTGVLIGRLSVTSVSAEGDVYEDLMTFTEVMKMALPMDWEATAASRKR